MTTIGERIKQRRQELGLTQQELALKVGYVNRSAIGRLETQGLNIPLDRLETIAEVLMVDVSYLLGEDDITPPPAEFSQQRKFLFSKIRDGDEDDIQRMYALWKLIERENG